MFPRIEYFDWLRDHRSPDFDLASTDVVLRPTGLRATLRDQLDPPPSTVDLNSQIAAEYGVKPSHVLVTAGATHANFVATAAALDPGSRILVESPGYEPLSTMPRGFDIPVDRLNRPAPSFTVDPARVTAAAGPEHGLVTVTNRHNPSGHRTDPDTLATIATNLADEAATLLVDEVYAAYGVSGTDGIGFGAESVAGVDNAVITSSLSKYFGLRGLRVGWLIADPTFINRARVVMDYVSGVAEPSVELASRIFHDPDQMVASARERIAANAPLLSEFIDSRPDLEGPVPADCTFGFPTYTGASGDTVADAAWDAGVLIIPGRFFNAPKRFRISVGAPPDTVKAGLSTLGSVLDSL